MSDVQSALRDDHGVTLRGVDGHGDGEGTLTDLWSGSRSDRVAGFRLREYDGLRGSGRLRGGLLRRRLLFGLLRVVLLHIVGYVISRRIKRLRALHFARGATRSRRLAADFGRHLVGERLQLRDDLRMLRGDVGLLADLGIEVIKTHAGGRFCRLLAHAFRLRRQRELPASLAYRLEVIGSEIIMGFARRLLGLSKKDRRDVAAIDDRRRGYGTAGEGDERRQKVDRGGDGVVDGTRRHAARPPRESRHAHAAFPGRALAAAERTGTAAVGALGQPRSVVGGEDHQRVLIETLRAQRVEHLADTPIDFLDPIAEATVLGFAGESRAGIDGRVDRVVGVVEVKGLVLVATDEVDGLLGVELDHAALTLSVHQLGDLLIPEEGDHRDLSLGALLEHVIGVGDAQVVVETLPSGQEFRLIPQVPFADHLGGISFFFKSFCYSYFSRV